MNLQQSQANELLYIGFNQTQGCFACGTDTGFRIYNCDPFKETFRRDFSSGGIGYVEMLFRCNILALVGGGKNPRYPPHKVMIWDDHQNRCIGELGFRSEVKAVKLRRDRVVVVLLHKIYVYNFSDLLVIEAIETLPNPNGLCALCPYSSNNVLACPGLQRGHVRVELYDLQKTTLIAAHESNLSCLALSFDGNRLATASDKGTLVRVFDTVSGNLLQELRRGVDRAEIYSICFNHDTRWLAVSSDKGTIHIFSLETKSQNDKIDQSISEKQSQIDEISSVNPRSSFAFMKSLLPKYFSSQWSFAQFRVPDVKTIVAFGNKKNSIIVVSSDGSYFKALFDPVNGGECTQETYAKFIKTNDE